MEWHKFTKKTKPEDDQEILVCRDFGHLSRADDDWLKWMVRQAKKWSVTNDKTD